MEKEDEQEREKLPMKTRSAMASAPRSFGN